LHKLNGEKRFKKINYKEKDEQHRREGREKNLANHEKCFKGRMLKTTTSPSLILELGAMHFVGRKNKKGGGGIQRNELVKWKGGRNLDCRNATEVFQAVSHR